MPCVPCLIFQSINNAAEFSIEALKNCIVILLLGAMAIALPLGLGQLIYLRMGKSGAGRNIRYGLTFCNFSFMGLPVIAELFGDLGIFYYTFFLVPVRIGYYALSEPLMTPPGVKDTKTSPVAVVKKTLLSPQFIALIIALVFWVGGWKLPETVQYCVKSLSSICSPVALLLCGMVVAEYDLKAFLRPKYLRLPILRTVMPCLAAVLSVFLALRRVFVR